VILTHKEITFTLKKRLSQKHSYIRIKRDGSVVVSTNYFTPKSTILKFIEQKQAWIKKEQEKLLKQPYHDSLSKEEAAAIIMPLVQKWSTIMIVSPTHVGFRKNRTRWGSCSSKNRLNFNTHLATMHPDFIEYVVVHELAHIRHKNHSKDFWAEVEKYLPDYKRRQKLIN
jgi:predicted metal-dependent hydrolase